MGNVFTIGFLKLDYGKRVEGVSQPKASVKLIFAHVVGG